MALGAATAAVRLAVAATRITAAAADGHGDARLGPLSAVVRGPGADQVIRLGKLLGLPTDGRWVMKSMA